MTDYEKGSPAWDIGMVLTRHTDGCERVLALKATAGMHMSGSERLTRAAGIACTCGAGNSPTEHTTERKAQCLPKTNDSRSTVSLPG